MSMLAPWQPTQRSVIVASLVTPLSAPRERPHRTGQSKGHTGNLDAPVADRVRVRVRARARVAVERVHRDRDNHVAVRVRDPARAQAGVVERPWSGQVSRGPVGLSWEFSPSPEPCADTRAPADTATRVMRALRANIVKSIVEKRVWRR
jgi:hypothetical protein